MGFRAVAHFSLISGEWSEDTISWGSQGVGPPVLPSPLLNGDKHGPQN